MIPVKHPVLLRGAGGCLGTGIGTGPGTVLGLRGIKFVRVEPRNRREKFDWSRVRCAYEVIINSSTLHTVYLSMFIVNQFRSHDVGGKQQVIQTTQVL